jgi:galactokinase
MGDGLHGLTVSAPGRICLFGEHQDYLHLPVIPCAISLRISVQSCRRDDSMVHLDLPDIGEEQSFSLEGDLSYVEKRDYFRSGINVLRREGFTFSGGLECIVRGEIPINSGTSSSSALTVAWIHSLARMSDQSKVLSAEDIAEYAHRAEVLEFSEPGGMMDHYSTAIGGMIFLDFSPRLSFEIMRADLKTFVLGDSQEPKDTKSILARVKDRVIRLTDQLKEKYPSFSIRNATVESMQNYASEFTEDEFALLEGTVRNHGITMEAKKVLQSKPLDHRKLGELLNAHQRILRDVLRISTPKIDGMLEAALDAGAYGGKINGSGGGGCMFVYAPENPERILKSIEKVGGKGYIVRLDEGTRIDAFETGEGKT